MFTYINIASGEATDRLDLKIKAARRCTYGFAYITLLLRHSFILAIGMYFIRLRLCLRFEVQVDQYFHV